MDRIIDSLNWWDIAGAIIAGLAISVVLGLWRSTLVTKVLNLASPVSFSFEGWWKSKFRTHLGEYQNIEIFRVRQYGDGISVKGWSYSGATGRVRHYSGKGKARGSSFSFLYAVNDTGSLQHGAYALKGASGEEGEPILRGIYIEFDDRKDHGSIAVGPEEYFATKVKLSIVEYIKLHFGYGKFGDFKRLENDYENL